MNTCSRPASLTRTAAARRLFAALAAMPTLMVFTPGVSAQTLSWTNAGNATLGGSGAWDTSSNKWWNGSTATTWGNTTTSDAIFGGTAGTVTLSQPITVNDITFNTTGYVVSGANVLTLAGTTPTISVGASLSATIGDNTATILDGTAGLTKTGAGTLTMNGTTANTFTGGVNVNGGTLALNFANLSGSTPFNNLIASSNSLSLSRGAVSITGKGVASSTTSQTFNTTTVNSGISSLTLTNGSGATSVTANLGNVTMNTGSTLMLTAPSASTRYFVTNGGSVTVPGSGNATFMRAGIMYGTGTGTRWAMVGTGGNVTASISSSPFGGSDPGAGSAQILANISNSSTPIGGNYQSYGLLLNPSFNTATVTIANGASWTMNGVIGISTNSAAVNASGTGRVLIGSEREFVVNLATSGNLTMGAPIADNGGGASNLTVSSTGTGITTLNGTNTYTGQTTINGGTTVIGSTGRINTSSGLVINGGTFRYNNTTNALTPATTLNAGTLTGTGAVTLGAVTVANDSGAIITNNSGAAGAALTVGNLVFNGAATLNLFLNSTSPALVAAGVTTNSTGVVTINPTNSAWVTASTHNLLSFTGGGIGGAGVGQFSIGTVSGLGPRQSVGTFGSTSSNLTLTINGDNPYWTGGTNGDWNTTQAGNWKLVTGGTDTSFIQGDDVQFTDAATGTTTLNLTGNVTTTSILFNNTTKDYTIGSSGGFGITSATSLTKNGSGNVTLGGANTYAGVTTVNAGILRAGSATAFGAAGNATLAFGAGSNGTIQLGGNSMTVVGLNSNPTVGTPILENANAVNATITLNNTAASSYAGVLRDGAGGGALSIAKLGTNTLTLSGNNSYTGATTIGGTAGGIIIGSNNALGTTAGNTTVGVGTSLGLSGGINYSTAEIIVGSGAGTTTAVGAFAAGSRGFIQSVSGNNTFAGAIQISANGTTRIGTQDGAQLNLSGPITMSGVTGVSVLFRAGGANGDFITLSNSGNSWDTDTQIFSSNNGAGSGVKLGVNNALPTSLSVYATATTGNGTTLDLAGFNQSLNGLTNAGSNTTLKISNSDSTKVSTLTLNNTTVDRATNGTVILDGAGKVELVKTGAFAQTLNGVNTYTGGTRIDQGTLTLGNATDTLADTGAVNVNGGTLALGTRTDTVGAVTLTSGSITGSGNSTQGILTGTGSNFDVRSGSASVKLAGSIGLDKSTAGTVTLSSNNTYTGLTTVSDGVLSITSTGSLAAGGSLTITGTGNATFANVGQTLGTVSNGNALNFTAPTGDVTLASLAGAGTTTFSSNGTATVSGGIATGTVNASNGLLAAAVSGGTVSAGSLNGAISGGAVTVTGLTTGAISGSGTLNTGSLVSSSVSGGINTVGGNASITTLSGGTTTVNGIATIGTMSAGTANLNGATSSITTLSGGNVALGGTTVLTVGGGTFGGNLTGGSLVTGGNFTFSLGSSFSGNATVSAGNVLSVDGTFSAGGVTVGSSGVLKGNGLITGNTTVQTGGLLAPGNSPGALVFGGDLYIAGTVQIEITGTAFTLGGTMDYDRIKLTGTSASLNLTDSILNLQWGVFEPAAGDKFGIFQLGAGASVSSGLLGGFAEGATVATIGGRDVKITYVADFGDSGTIALTGGNDIALYTPIPEPSTYAALAGLGAIGLTLYRRRRSVGQKAA